jgi:hypothetical protein
VAAAAVGDRGRPAADRSLRAVDHRGHAGLFFYAATRALAGAPLVARNDPFLRESLAHHQ